MGNGGLVVLFAVAAITLAGCGGGDSPATDKPASKPKPNVGDGIGAQVVCREFVKDRLKSPSSAHFSDEKPSQIAGPVWVVFGNVDADNSFGASLRMEYTCKVKFAGGDNWKLVTLTGIR